VRTRVAYLTAAGIIVLAAGVGRAQLAGPPTAAWTPLVELSGVHTGTAVRAALRVSLPEGLHVQSNKPRDASLIPTRLTVDPPPGITATEVVFPDSIDLAQVGADQPLAVFEREFTIGVQFAVARSVLLGDVTVPGRLRYQACNDTMCFAPRTADFAWTLRIVPARVATTATHQDVFGRLKFGHGEPPGRMSEAAPPPQAADAGASNVTATLDDFTLLSTTDGYQGASAFLKFIHDADNGVKARGLFDGRGPLAILLIVFVGGLALNLTPCVLPMIPINLAIIGAGAQAGSRTRGLLLGGAYGAAMAAVYGVLGLVVILTAGTFGTINASPWFNAGIAALFVALALAMFDVITIDFSRLSSRFRVDDARRGSLVVAFAMGAVAALLAGACVAPVVVQVVLFSSDLYAKGTTAALVLPFVLGLGMAMPWPVAGAGIAALPRPGAWMVRVKQVMGAVIFATAIYYGYEAYTLFSNRFVNAAEVSASVQEKLRAGWHPLDEGLATAKRERKRVLIDMWATWCKNCLTMDKTTLEDREVTAALSGYVKIKFQAENPDEPSVKATMRRFGAVGLPTYVILAPRQP
jgi:thiol:disulfide interchange protein DsbD